MFQPCFSRPDHPGLVSFSLNRDRPFEHVAEGGNRMLVSARLCAWRPVDEDGGELVPEQGEEDGLAYPCLVGLQDRSCLKADGR